MKKFVFILFTTLSILGFVSCQKKPEAKKPQILVSIPSYEKLLNDIFADRYEVICVVPEGFNPHYFEVKPSDLNKIQNPEFWFGVNESFEKKLIETLSFRFSNLKYINLIETIPKNALENDHECDHHHHHDHHHDIDMVDNHIWMSPRLLELQLKFIKKTIPNLTKTEVVAFNQLETKLQNLDSKLSEKLRPCSGKAILVSHPSFGYFCKDYNIQQISIECEGKQPMPRDLENLEARLRNSSIICVFSQPQFDQKGAILIAKKLNKPLYSIDPYSKNYFEMMNELEEKLLRQP